MNETLQKRINSYTMAAGCFLYLNQEASAQVVYMDIDPDIVLSDGGQAAEIDMNDDGISDFFFHNNSFLYYDTSWLSTRTMKNILVGPDEIGNALAGISNYFTTGYGEFTRYYPFAVNQGSLISELNSWQTTETQIMALRVYSSDGAVVGSGGYCYWFNFAIPETIDHFLGIRFKDEESLLHYGWIRCDVLDNGRTLIIKDYAYEMEPDYLIAAGDTAHFVSILDNDKDQPFITSFGNIISISIKSVQNDVNVYIYETSGKLIYQASLTEKISNFTLLVPHGVYLINLQLNNKSYNKKVLI